MKQILPNIFAEKLNAKDNRWKIVHGKLYIYQREQLSDVNVREIELPPGSYEILFTTKDCTEEQAAGVVAIREANGYPIGYKDYEDNNQSFRNAIDSLRSLFRANDLDLSKNFLLLKTNTPTESSDEKYRKTLHKILTIIGDCDGDYAQACYDISETAYESLRLKKS